MKHYTVILVWSFQNFSLGTNHFCFIFPAENITNWWDDKDKFAFGRGSQAFIVFNLDKKDKMKDKTLQVSSVCVWFAKDFRLAEQTGTVRQTRFVAHFNSRKVHTELIIKHRYTVVLYPYNSINSIQTIRTSF